MKRRRQCNLYLLDCRRVLPRSGDGIQQKLAPKAGCGQNWPPYAVHAIRADSSLRPLLVARASQAAEKLAGRRNRLRMDLEKRVFRSLFIVRSLTEP
jgi:hypothetical protein